MLEKLPPRERQIVDLLYAQGSRTVAEVCDALPDPLSASAVRAMLTRLEAKGYVRRSPSERGSRCRSPSTCSPRAANRARNHSREVSHTSMSAREPATRSAGTFL